MTPGEACGVGRSGTPDAGIESTTRFARISATLRGVDELERVAAVSCLDHKAVEDVRGGLGEHMLDHPHVLLIGAEHFNPVLEGQV